jgi:type VI protein secretion system component VasF
MHERLARQVHAVFAAGLDVKDRLGRGEKPGFEAEQARLRNLLLADGELRYAAEYAGEGAAAKPGQEPFLGIRFPLACWLDEIFADSPWAQHWAAASMEAALYGGSNQRAVQFWEQAKKAEVRPGGDALEVFLWCAVLGFRGEPDKAGVNPTQWLDMARQKAISGCARDFPQPAGNDPPTLVPPLRGRQRLSMTLRLTVAVLAAVAFASPLMFRGAGH